MTNDNGSGLGQGVAAVDRALAIADAIAAGDEPITLAEISRTTGMYKSTILRLIGSLQAAGYVQRLRDGRYALGPAIFRLAVAYERMDPLRQHVLPVLEELVRKGSESASFHTLHGPHNRLCLFRVDSSHPTLDRINSGDILPLERGAAGRILMAFSGRDGSDYDALRAQYFALSIGEREAGCAGMASPVFGPEGNLRGAISLSGAANRFTPEMISEWQPRLLTAAAEVTRSLGGSYPNLAHP
ncbi:IclR family transcriptional regulator [Novosphingobium endophyticum]|nr:IclR family transcriptional regulator [Novosphingobium endophyticum]